MELAAALDFARTTPQSVFVSLRGDGRPQLSNVMHAVGDDGVIRVSTTVARAKCRNVSRRPWAAVHVTRADFYAYAVLEGIVELSAVAAAPDDAAVEELVGLYRSLRGEHPDWDDYRTTMVTDRRLVIRLRPDRVYGMLPGPD